MTTSDHRFFRLDRSCSLAHLLSLCTGLRGDAVIGAQETLISLNGPHSPMAFPVIYRLENAQDAQAIDLIHQITFGPGRFARAAYHLREGLAPLGDLSFVAEVEGEVVGSVRITPMHVGVTPCLLLGPLAVLPAYTRAGIGGALMRHAMEAARVQGHHLVLLVGDLAFYYPFGFRRVSVRDIDMPLPVDPDRLLVAELIGGAAKDLKGRALKG